MVVKQIVEPGQPMAFETGEYIIPLSSIWYVRKYTMMACVPDGGDMFVTCDVCLGDDVEIEMGRKEKAAAFLEWYRRVVAVTHA